MMQKIISVILREDVSKKHRAIVEQLKKTLVKGRKVDGIMLKKVNKKVLKSQ